MKQSSLAQHVRNHQPLTDGPERAPGAVKPVRLRSSSIARGLVFELGCAKAIAKEYVLGYTRLE